MKVIGTAGHVDHGKSRLVLSLTGINPDRLKEEQEREMTIDLGFAWMELPGEEPIGIIDVPGHSDFIDNMLAGVGAIDAALIVIAADEGIMPQTREHLSILDLLDINRAIVALTKIDLVEEEEWLALVTEEIREMLKSTKLAEAPIIPVSSETGAGMEGLVNTIFEVLHESKVRRNIERPRLPIDRVFSISGFGTIVTGTLIDGTIHAGQEVVVLPAERKTRIRGLQTHKKKVETAVPGSRVAANLIGMEVAELERGDVVTVPGFYKETRTIEVHYRHLDNAVTKLKHNMNLKLFTGTTQRTVRVRLLGCDEINPGDIGWLQLVLEKPIIADRGDRYILRRPSPGATLGGGVVVEPYSNRIRKRFDERNIQRLERLMHGNPGDLLLQSLNDLGPTSLDRAIRHANLEKEEDQAVQELLSKGELIVWDDRQSNNIVEGSSLVVSKEAWKGFINQMIDKLGSFHEEYPLRLGMPKEELKMRLGFQAKDFSLMIQRAVKDGVIRIDHDRVANVDHNIVLSKSQEKAIAKLLDIFNKAPYTTPSVKESIELVGNELYQYLLDSEALFQLSKDVVFRYQDYKKMSVMIQDELEQKGRITIAQVRDIFLTSRKYALALMEHMDAIGVTKRKGDERILAKS